MKTNKMTVINQSVGQSMNTSNHTDCLSSCPCSSSCSSSACASLTQPAMARPSLPAPSAASSSIGKQDQTGDKTMASSPASVTISKSAPISGWPSDHGNKFQCFKFTSNQPARGVYQTRSRSSFVSSSSSSSSSPSPSQSPSPSVSPSSSLSSLSSYGAISGVAPPRSNTGRDVSLLANHKYNDSSSTTPSSSPPSSSPAMSSAAPSAPALQSSQVLPPRSSRKIGSGRAPRRVLDVYASLRHHRQLKGSTASSLRRRITRGVISLAALLIVSTQLGHVLSPSADVCSVASAQFLLYDNRNPSSSADDPRSAAQRTDESSRYSAESARELREARPMTDKLPVNLTNVFQVLFKKKPYSKYWTVEQKWDDLFRRGMAVQDTMRQVMLKNFLRDIEHFADITISPSCERDLKYIQSYARQSTNFRWLGQMFDSTGKSEPGMLTGMLANLGHPVQCVRVRAPGRPSNDTFDERFFDQQTALLGERFRGKYCLASVRPVLPTKPIDRAVSRFSDIMNASLISNISYTGEPEDKIKQRTRQMHIPASVYSKIDRAHLRLDQVPFESELYEYLIVQRNFMFTLPRFMGVCYPSSCSRDDVRMSIQRTMDATHQVVDVEFECEQEEHSAWDWFSTPRLIAYVVVGLIAALVFLASLTRYILLSKLQIKRSKLKPNSGMASLLDALDMFSVDKCAGILFVKTKPASPWVDWTKVENNRSTTIDALRGFLILVLVYSQMTVLGCLPVPFMWSKWSDTMFPFYRSMLTQLFLNMNIWAEAFYLISAYIIALKVLENFRPKPLPTGDANGTIGACQRPRPVATYNPVYHAPSLFSFVVKRYLRLVLPMASFVLLNYVWPRLSHGFVMQDQAGKIMKPCDSYGWTNFLLFHNHNPMNETCLWPSHVSASFFQLHLLSYPLLTLCLMALYSQFRVHYGDYDENKQRKKFISKLLAYLVFALLSLLALAGAIYPALQASSQSLTVPFLIDYLDYDNYQRVIEWMVLPTYNHLTSYMFGLGTAFIIIRRRAGRELRKAQASQWAFEGTTGQYHQREGSIESTRSSSTQELHQQDGLTFKVPFGGIGIGSPANRHIDGQQIHQKQFNMSTGSSVSSERRYEDDSSLEDASSQSKLSRFLRSTSCLVLCLGSLLASWLWNGLGQPMSDQQTFWFVLVTKLVFCSTFAYLFHEHFATRRNSTNPWMLTRFLVPIGRMSLTVFYVGWLVIWFDLLSSLYQWHPSHYFICEKYNEIIFITLILAMFIYGAFEGIVKRIQYASRDRRLKHDIKMSATGDVAGPTGERKRYQMRPFESFFDPEDKPSLLELQNELKLREVADDDSTDKSKSSTNDNNDSGNNLSGTNKIGSLSTIDALRQQPVTVHQSNLQGGAKPMYLTSTGDVSVISGYGGGNLSPSDRYKLNAELRANYSFASIGLYESAGATSDLSHHHTSDPNDKRR